MSYVDAAILAGAGTNQMFPGHAAFSQTINDGILALTPKSEAKPSPEIFTPKPSPSLQGKARYEFLRNIQHAQPTGIMGRKADILLRENRLFARARLSPTARRAHTSRMDKLIKAAFKEPGLMAKVDPQNKLRAALEPSGQKRRYDVLTKLTAQPKIISLRQLPQLQRGIYNALKDSACTLLPAEARAIAKPVLALAETALKPHMPPRRRPLLTYAFA